MSSRREASQFASSQRVGLTHGADDEPYFSTPQLRQRLALLTHLCANATRPILLLGEPGAGKTHFLRVAKQTLTAPFSVVLWDGRNDSTVAQMLADIADALGAIDEDDSQESMAEAVRIQLVRLNATGRAPVFLVDDADQLATAVLEQLIVFGSTREGWLRLVLSGGTGLAEQADSLYRGEGPDWIPRIELPALTLAQTPDYLSLRLTHTGWSGASPFDWRLCEQFHASSRGNPGELNRLAADYLHAEDQPKHTPPVVPSRAVGRNHSLTITGISAMTLIVVGVAAIWLWPSDEDHGETDSIREFSLPQRPALPPAEVISSTPPIPAPVPVAELSPAPVPPPEPAAASESESLTASQVPDPDSVPASPVVAPPPPVTTATQVTVADASSPVSSSRPRPRPPPRLRVPPETGAQQASAPPPPSPSPAPSPPAPPPATAPAPAPASVPVNAGRYVVQLAAFRELQAALGFIAKHQLERYARVYIVGGDGSNDLFAVIVGRFQTRTEAVDTIAQLPDSLKANDPWPRTLKGLRLISIPQ